MRVSVIAARALAVSLPLAAAACDGGGGGGGGSSSGGAPECAEGQIQVWDAATESWACGAESDPAFTASAASGVTSADVTSWDEAAGWGDHAQAGYLDAESDPAFMLAPASQIALTDMANWDAAFDWGDHAEAGYLVAESDPAFAGSAAFTISSTQVTNWDLAHAWGNHALEGYLESETDPEFELAPASDITSTQIGNWDDAHAWGDHSSVGYLLSTDPVAQSADYQHLVRAASAGLNTTADHGVWLNGVQIFTTMRSYGLVAIDRATGTVTHQQTYDVFGDITDAGLLATELASYDTDTIVILTTYDEPSSNRFGTSNALRTQILRCGGTAERFDAVVNRGAYLLVGQCGAGAGSGLEMASTISVGGSGPADAALEASFRIVDGELRDLPPRTITISPTSSTTLSTANTFATLSGLTHTFTLTRPTMVSASYSLSMAAGGSGSQHLITRLAITREEGVTDRTVDPVEARAITGDTTYWSSSGRHASVFGPGQYTVSVEYRTPAGGTNNPGAGDFTHRQLTLRFDDI